jgi:hypothetical protein
METVLKFLALGAIIATVILLPLAFVAAHLLTLPPPNLKILGRRFIGKILIPYSSFSVLAFGFLIIYVSFGWISLFLPDLSLSSFFQIGKFRLDWAVPAFVIAWTMLKFTGRQNISN